jgi:hypothetical protein
MGRYARGARWRRGFPSSAWREKVASATLTRCRSIGSLIERFPWLPDRGDARASVPESEVRIVCGTLIRELRNRRTLATD